MITIVYIKRERGGQKKPNIMFNLNSPYKEGSKLSHSTTNSKKRIITCKVEHFGNVPIVANGTFLDRNQFVCESHALKQRPNHQ